MKVIKVPGMKKQLVDTLYDVQMAAADKTSKTGNIIVMGILMVITAVTLIIGGKTLLKKSKIRLRHTWSY